MSRYIVIEGNLAETPALAYGESSGKCQRSRHSPG